MFLREAEYQIESIRCPFDPSHFMPRQSFVRHLSRCKSVNKDDFEQCPYDVYHVIRKQQYANHCKECTSKKQYDGFASINWDNQEKQSQHDSLYENILSESIVDELGQNDSSDSQKLADKIQKISLNQHQSLGKIEEKISNDHQQLKVKDIKAKNYVKLNSYGQRKKKKIPQQLSQSCVQHRNESTSQYPNSNTLSFYNGMHISQSSNKSFSEVQSKTSNRIQYASGHNPIQYYGQLYPPFNGYQPNHYYQGYAYSPTQYFVTQMSPIQFHPYPLLNPHSPELYPNPYLQKQIEKRNNEMKKKKKSENNQNKLIKEKTKKNQKKQKKTVTNNENF